MDWTYWSIRLTLLSIIALLIYHSLKFLFNVILRLLDNTIGKSVNHALPFIHPKKLHLSVGNIGLVRLSKILIKHDNNLRIEIELFKSWLQIIYKIVIAFIKKNSDPIILNVHEIRLIIQLDELYVFEDYLSKDKQVLETGIFQNLLIFAFDLVKNVASKIKQILKFIVSKISRSSNKNESKNSEIISEPTWLPNIKININSLDVNIMANSLPLNYSHLQFSNFILDFGEKVTELSFYSQMNIKFEVFKQEIITSPEHKINLVKSESVHTNVLNSGKLAPEILKRAESERVTSQIHSKPETGVQGPVSRYISFETTIEINMQPNQILDLNLKSTQVDVQSKIFDVLLEIDYANFLKTSVVGYYLRKILQQSTNSEEQRLVSHKNLITANRTRTNSFNNVMASIANANLNINSSLRNRKNLSQNVQQLNFMSDLGPSLDPLLLDSGPRKTEKNGLKQIKFNIFPIFINFEMKNYKMICEIEKSNLNLQLNHKIKGRF